MRVPYKDLHSIDVKNKTVILRADLNVPVDKDKNVTDTSRIDRLKPTIDYLRTQQAKVLILSHFGRPKGEIRDEYSLSFLPPVLQKQWGTAVKFATDCVGEEAEKIELSMNYGEIALLENTRFHKGEEENNQDFARKLSLLGDVFVHDAFSAAHRAHASTEGIAHYLPTAAGFLMQEELSALNAALENPERPVMALVGGAKISTKIDLLENLVAKTDFLVLGGGMANTFLFAAGIDVKASLCEPDMVETVHRIIKKAADAGCGLILPIDLVVAEKFEAGAPNRLCGIREIPDGYMALDIGMQSINIIREKMKLCKTLVWNGPMGAFEIEPFDIGTTDLAEFAAELTEAGKLKTIAGGGDTVAALDHAGVKDKFSYVSTAGGAFLEWLEGKTLPGVAALSAYQNAA